MAEKKKLTIDDVVSDKKMATLNLIVKLSGQKRALSIARRRYAGSRGLKKNHVSPYKECFLCGETRVLDECHIFPVWWSSCFDFDKLSDLPHYLADVMWLCPTHHRLYDHYKLNDKETAILRKAMYTYRNNLADLMLRIGYANPKNPSRETYKELDKFIEGVWKWWRVYYAY